MYLFHLGEVTFQVVDIVLIVINNTFKAIITVNKFAKTSTYQRVFEPY